MHMTSLNSPLQFAAAKDHNEIVALLLENGADVNSWNYCGQMALMQACRYGHWEVVQTLLLFRCNVTRVDYLSGRTTLHFAAVNGHVRCIRLVVADFVPSVPFESVNALTKVDRSEGSTVKSRHNQRHVSTAWCRSLVISMALIIPLHTRPSSEIQVPNLPDSDSENTQLLCVDLQKNELWNSSFEDPNHLKILETKWNPSLSKIKNGIIKKVSDEDLETATTLLRSSYNFYRDTSCAMLPSSVNLYMAPSQLATETYIQLGIDGVDILDMNTPRKLLLWAYTLLTGDCPNISVVIKYCEENAKSSMKKGTGSSSVPSSTGLPTAMASHAGGGKVGVDKCSELGASSANVEVASLPETECTRSVASNSLPESENKCNVTSDSLPETVKVENVASSSMLETGSSCNLASVSQLETDSTSNVSFSSLPDSKSMHRLNATSSNQSQKILSATPCLLQCNSIVLKMSNVDDEPDGADPSKG